MCIRVYLKINTRIIFNRCCCCVFFPLFPSPTFYSDFLDFSHSVCLSRYKVLSHCQRKSFDFFRLLSNACSLQQEEFVYQLNCCELCAYVKICRQFLDSFICYYIRECVQALCIEIDTYVCVRWCINDTDNQCWWFSWWRRWWRWWRSSSFFWCYVRRISSIRMQRFNDIFRYTLFSFAVHVCVV